MIVRIVFYWPGGSGGRRLDCRLRFCAELGGVCFGTCFYPLSNCSWFGYQFDCLSFYDRADGFLAAIPYSGNLPVGLASLSRCLIFCASATFLCTRIIRQYIPHFNHF
ncbi:hypothetical protein L873DRAFT_1318347 [Choiromyces venosus 120613-1]|uniref:Uncharacterized protein n=1 Tax=Choiromyces venosus 120613-1 TaxID=1336337 RepID=A0A3N4JAU8_9PEZI|nr:hypothetical protein L873DRAFT_1318347 [Choiromyces venosus 120613-1]